MRVRDAVRAVLARRRRRRRRLWQAVACGGGAVCPEAKSAADGTPPIALNDWTARELGARIGDALYARVLRLARGGPHRDAPPGAPRRADRPDLGRRRRPRAGARLPRHHPRDASRRLGPAVQGRPVADPAAGRGLLAALPDDAEGVAAARAPASSSGGTGSDARRRCGSRSSRAPRRRPTRGGLQPRARREDRSRLARPRGRRRAHARAHGGARRHRLRPVLRLLQLLPGRGGAAARGPLLPLRPRAAARGGRAAAGARLHGRAAAPAVSRRGGALAGRRGRDRRGRRRDRLRVADDARAAHGLDRRRRHALARARRGTRASSRPAPSRGIVGGALAVLLTLRGLRGRSVRSLLARAPQEWTARRAARAAGAGRPGSQSRPRCCSAAGALGPIDATGAFFGAGTLLLAASLLLVADRLAGEREPRRVRRDGERHGRSASGRRPSAPAAACSRWRSSPSRRS